MPNSTQNTVISNVTAAEISNYAYTANTPPQGSIVTMPDGSQWTNLGTQTSSDGATSFTVFANSATQQIVMAFKGTDNLTNAESDLENSGYTAWQSIQGQVYNQIQSLNSQYPGYSIMTDGHSLGGGLAQTAALIYGLSGYGQNSLPVSDQAVTNIFGGQAGFNTADQNWQANGHTFNEVNVTGDVATEYYEGVLGENYISTQVQTLGSPYAAYEQAGGELSIDAAENPEEGWAAVALAAAGVGVVGTAGVKAHSINTVIALEQSDPSPINYGTVSSSCMQSLTTTLATVTSSTLNSDGTVTLTTITGSQYTVTPLQPNAGNILCEQIQSTSSSGQVTTQTETTIMGTSGQSYSSSQLDNANDIVDLPGGNTLVLPTGNANGLKALRENLVDPLILLGFQGTGIPAARPVWRRTIALSAVPTGDFQRLWTPFEGRT